jgi:hypothetical protein
LAALFVPQRLDADFFSNFTAGSENACSTQVAYKTSFLKTTTACLPAE